MLEKMSDVPESVLGIRGSGDVTGDDYRNVMIPAVTEALQRQEKIRLLYILGEDVSAFSAGAVWQDTKTGVGHYTKWEKMAVVTDKDWIRHSINIVGHLIPGQVKGFTLEEEALARSWVAS